MYIKNRSDNNSSKDMDNEGEVSTSSYEKPKESSLSTFTMSKESFVNYMMGGVKKTPSQPFVFDLVLALYNYIHTEKNMFTEKIKQKFSFCKNVKCVVHTFLIVNMENKIDKYMYKPSKNIKTIIFSWCIEYYTKLMTQKQFVTTQRRQLLEKNKHEPRSNKEKSLTEYIFR